MLYSEFLTGIEKEHSEGTAYAYEVINKLYMEDQLKDHQEAFKYFNDNRNEFMWVNDLNIGNGKRINKSEHLKEIIPNDEAIEIINKEFGFEKDKIIICSTPYFEAWDDNFIVFLVKGYSRVFHSGELYDVLR